MNYETAKKLKNAGFQKRSGAPIFIEDDFFPPTLSELIEACIPFFDRLVSDKVEIGKWHAIGYRDKDIFIGIGSNLEEAVANLWLELNKK